MLYHILVGGKALYSLLGKISVRHGMADNNNFPSFFFEKEGNFSACLAFSASCPDSTDRYDRELAFYHRLPGTEEGEICSSS